MNKPISKYTLMVLINATQTNEPVMHFRDRTYNYHAATLCDGREDPKGIVLQYRWAKKFCRMCTRCKALSKGIDNTWTSMTKPPT